VATTEKMFRRTDVLLAAVSGGPDSVALLLVLCELRARFGFEVIMAHFDHKLRESSAADMERVRIMARSLGVECFTGEGDVRAVAAGERAGIEETARKMRYQFLSFVAGEKRADCVATGHTADDQAETVLMRIVRGSGVRGIRGMLPVSGVPGAEAQRLVRPLLPLRRADTLAICAEAGIEPVIDASNDDVSFARNRLRHETLPALRALNPSVDLALLRLAGSARAAFGDIEREALGIQPIARLPIGSVFEVAPFGALHDEARTLVIEREAAFSNVECEVNSTRVRNLASVVEVGNGAVRFGETVVEVSCGRVRIGPPLREAEQFEPRVVNVPGVTVAGPWRLSVSTEATAGAVGALTAVLDSSLVRGVLRVRLAVAGDRIQYRGLARRVPDVFASARVPRWDRLGAVAVVDSRGVVAVFGSHGVITDVPRGDDALYVSISPA
jgi:tRNA(Ile)-lysidine synthetase-like protein